MPNHYHVSVTDEPIDITKTLELVENKAHGAVVNFMGAVRNFNQGKKVFIQLCEAESQKTTEPLCIAITHRQGRLNVGELSIMIAVSSPHRGEAFTACRNIIEEIKHQCPIWKKEFYEDGETQWVQGHALCQHAK